MKKTFISLFALILAHGSFCQHYYKDLLVVETANKKHKLQRTNKVKSIKFLSFDSDNSPIDGFISNQQFNRDYSEVVTNSTTPLTGATQNISKFNEQDQLVMTIDTAEGTITTITYEYDTKGKISTITNTTNSAGGFFVKEVHVWLYTLEGKPSKMFKIKNNKDSTVVNFTIDEKGNVTEEKSLEKKRQLPVYYYYYEDNNLTDIVRYNFAAKRLLPDYVFEYEEKDRLASMLVVPEEGSEYQKWYYSYDEDGLKILDACYSKTKQLIGRIEYQYDYYK